MGPSAAVLRGQTYLQTGGSPTFTTKIPVENGWIDASSGRLHLEFPIATSPERGGKSHYFAKIYDSNIWTHTTGTWQPSNAGWSTIDSGLGNISFSSHYAGSCVEGGGPKYLIYNSWTFVDPSGTPHYFPITIYENLYPDFCSGSDTPNANAFANDASGYYMVITDYSNSTVYGPDGSVSFGGYTGGQTGVKDSNGNGQGILTGSLSTTVTPSC